MKLIRNSRHLHGILATLIVTILIAAAAVPGIVEAKSVYLASEHHRSLFDAWNINPDGTVTYQATYGLSYATDPAGIAIDNDSETLFITSEFSPGVEIVDPVTLTYLGVSTGPRDLAGIAVDDLNDIVYSVQRMTGNLYIFQWDPVALSLTEIDQIDLPNCMGAFGIALDEFTETLWVADAGGGSTVCDYDYFEVTGVGNTTVDIEVISDNFDWYMELLDSAGNWIEYAVDPSAGMGYPVKFTGVVPDGGAVYFAIADLYCGTGDYQIAVWPTGSPAPGGPQDSESEPNDSFGDRNVIASTGEIVINGTIGILAWHPMVRAYDTNTWVEDTGRSFTPSHVPIDVAVDRVRNFVYTVSITGGAMVPPGTGSTLLSKWDVAAETETTVDMGYGGVGLAVDEVTGYVYVTGFGAGGDNIAVWDTSTMPFTLIQDTGRIGNPAGIAIGNVSYNPLNLAKNDIIQGEGVYIGMTFTYEITFDSPAFNLTNVTVTDNLPVELDFVSASDGGVYDPVERTVTWDLGDISAGAPVPTLLLEVEVNENAQPDTTIYNYATIDGDQIPPTTVIDQDPLDPGDDPGTPVLPFRPVPVDIKPASCPNPLNLKSKGVLPVAILGTDSFDATQVDPSTITLQGVAPVRWAIEDVAAPYSPYIGKESCWNCTTAGPDGYSDLTLKFDTQAIVEALGEVEDGDCVKLTITGQLKEEFGGSPIIGEDLVWIVKKA